MKQIRSLIYTSFFDILLIEICFKQMKPLGAYQKTLESPCLIFVHYNCRMGILMQ